MKRKSIIPFLILFFVLLWLMSRPKTTSDSVQGTVVSWIAPFWQWIAPVKDENQIVLKLQVENQLLKMK